MAWITADYSKKAVKRAGECLINEDASDDAVSSAMDVLSNWRSAHAYPMHAVLIFLRNQSAKIDANSIVVQRLKRTPSIVGKLKRIDGIKLHRMQDISGCRSVVASIRKVRALRDSIVNSRTRHKLHREDDYISQPKVSGYRGVHLVYKYNGRKNEYQDYFVEIQIRSKVQHAWATAVEVVEHFTKQALKSSQGNKDWLDFFRYASAEFSKLENSTVDPGLAGTDTYAEMKRLEQKLNAKVRLNAFTVSTQFIAERSDRKSDYFLLELTEHASKIQVTQFPPETLGQATQQYIECEKKAKEQPEYDVVLVSASSVHSLMAAYPNYFADSKDFLGYLDRTIQRYEETKNATKKGDRPQF